MNKNEYQIGRRKRNFIFILEVCLNFQVGIYNINQMIV